MDIVYADFNNADPDGYLRLNTVGTISDLSRMSKVLEDGASFVVSDGDLVAEIVVRRPGSEGIWRGEVVSGPFDILEASAKELLRGTKP